MRKTFLRIGALMAFFAVLLGAFGAHALKGILTTDNLNTFETGVRYQFYHAFAIIMVGLLRYQRKTNLLINSGWLFTAGILFFSGSLYLIAVRGVFGLSMAWLGPITPIGGSLFLLGWVFFFFSSFQENQRRMK